MTRCEREVCICLWWGGGRSVGVGRCVVGVVCDMMCVGRWHGHGCRRGWAVVVVVSVWRVAEVYVYVYVL
jgi:hypothetical protein